MTTVVIEVHDTGIVLADSDAVHANSPAVAVVDGRDLVFGDQARARARLNPRFTFDRFWEQLDQQPLARPAGPAQSHADLAYFHLRKLWAATGLHADTVLVAAPAGYDSDQLALLLGIVQACDIPVEGLVAAPVAAAAAAGAGPVLLLDTRLHRTSAIAIDNGYGLRLGDVRLVARSGMADLEDAWAGLIAQRFIHDTRFDPLHHAASEQALFAALPRWLAALKRQVTARLALDTGQRRYHIDMDRETLARAADSVYTPLVEAAANSQAQVVLSYRLARLPGLAERVRGRCAAEPVILAEDAVTRGALAYRQAIVSDAAAPAYVTRLPVSAPKPARADAAWPVHDQACPAPTHILHGWRAYALSAAALALPPQAEPSARSWLDDGAVLLHPEGDGVTVNGQPARGDMRLAIGDCIEAGGQSMYLIAAVAGDGTA